MKLNDNKALELEVKFSYEDRRYVKGVNHIELGEDELDEFNSWLIDEYDLHINIRDVEDLEDEFTIEFVSYKMSSLLETWLYETYNDEWIWEDADLEDVDNYIDDVTVDEIINEIK